MSISPGLYYGFTDPRELDRIRAAMRRETALEYMSRVGIGMLNDPRPQLGIQNAIHDPQSESRYALRRYGIPMIWEDMT